MSDDLEAYATLEFFGGPMDGETVTYPVGYEPRRVHYGVAHHYTLSTRVRVTHPSPNYTLATSTPCYEYER